MTEPAFACYKNASKPGPSSSLPAAGRRRLRGEDAFTKLWIDGDTTLLRYLRVVAPEAAGKIAADTWVGVLRKLISFRGDQAAGRA